MGRAHESYYRFRAFGKGLVTVAGKHRLGFNFMNEVETNPVVIICRSGEFIRTEKEADQRVFHNVGHSINVGNTWQEGEE